MIDHDKAQNLLDLLSIRERDFVLAYVSSGGVNATRAAITAGYAKSGAHVQASRMLRRSKVKEAILALGREVCEEAKEKAVESATRVLEDAREIFEIAMRGVPIRDQRGRITGYKPDLANANRALENIGKHIDVNAFIERRDLTSKGDKLDGEKKLYVLRINGQDIEFE